MSILDLFKKHQKTPPVIEKSISLSSSQGSESSIRLLDSLSSDYDGGVDSGGKKGSKRANNKLLNKTEQVKSSKAKSFDLNTLVNGEDNVRELATVHYAKALLGDELVPNIHAVYDEDSDVFDVASEYLGAGSPYVVSLDEYARDLNCVISDNTRSHVCLVSGDANKENGELVWNDLPPSLRRDMSAEIVVSALIGDHDFNPGNFIVFINPEAYELLNKFTQFAQTNQINTEAANNISNLFEKFKSFNTSKKELDQLVKNQTALGVKKKDLKKDKNYIELEMQLITNRKCLINLLTEDEYRNDINNLSNDPKMNGFTEVEKFKSLECLKIGRIDLGHSLGHLVNCSSIFGGEVHDKENPILDFFNREKIGGMSKGGIQSKLWRDYPAVVPSQEMVNALREIHRLCHDEQKLEVGKAETKKSFEALSGVNKQRLFFGYKQSESMNHILTSLKKICSGLNVTKLNGSPVVEPSELDSRCNDIHRFVKRNADNLEKVANVMELQLNIDKFLKGELDDIQAILSKCKLDELPCSGKNIHWVKTGEKNKAMVCTFEEYVKARAQELIKNTPNMKEIILNNQTSLVQYKPEPKPEWQKPKKDNTRKQSHLVEELSSVFRSNSFFSKHRLPEENNKIDNDATRKNSVEKPMS